MPDFKLTATGPRSGTSPDTVTCGGYTLTCLPGLALASVACRQGCAANGEDRLRDLLEADPPSVGRWGAGPHLSAYWTGQDQWMIWADPTEHEELAQRAAAALDGLASVTEQSDGWACFDLTGPGLTAVLERLVTCDVAAMETRDAQRSVIDHVGCFLLCQEADSAYRVLTPRSSARSVHHAIVTCFNATVAMEAVRTTG